MLLIIIQKNNRNKTTLTSKNVKVLIKFQREKINKKIKVTFCYHQVVQMRFGKLLDHLNEFQAQVSPKLRKELYYVIVYHQLYAASVQSIRKN